ncbi:hypothetical protein SAMN05421753_107218 [Planctomicrobium piriforme]|uniref:Uncharacterized protein n=1 Tax=Planctomicrobium piriforme TaxID=1576369 RepID=A0A1I3H208_9PLAN|nr:hypothetical protein SAMN05421753_107218 [Planctomicrobium piriforme]
MQQLRATGGLISVETNSAALGSNSISTVIARLTLYLQHLPQCLNSRRSLRELRAKKVKKWGNRNFFVKRDSRQGNGNGEHTRGDPPGRREVFPRLGFPEVTSRSGDNWHEPCVRLLSVLKTAKNRLRANVGDVFSGRVARFRCRHSDTRLALGAPRDESVFPCRIFLSSNVLPDGFWRIASG